MDPDYIQESNNSQSMNDSVKDKVSNYKSSTKVFSNDVEIALVQGLYEYLISIGDKKMSWNEFYAFINPKLSELASVEYKKKQIYEKVRSLEEKHLKGKGIDWNAHDYHVFELFNKIWKYKKTANNVPSKKRDYNEIVEERMRYDYPNLFASFEEGSDDKAKQKCHLIGRENAMDLELEFLKLREIEYDTVCALEHEVEKLRLEFHRLLLHRKRLRYHRRLSESMS